MSIRETHLHIETIEELSSFCQRSRSSQIIGFDTEFVSENRYQPELCLLQVATDTEYAIIDTLAISDLSEFWKLLVEGNHLTLVHAAREEFLFCFRACGKRPQNLFDVQLAAGMIGLEYPAAYGNLVSKLLGITLDKGETRTDWMKRPLSSRQINYALQDVIHLQPLYEKISKKLVRLNRQHWLREEMDNWQTTLEKAECEPQWQRVAGISGLNNRQLAIVRELWLVRNDEARRRNRSAKRVLPDDLIVELARRGTADPKRLKAIRGFEGRVNSSLTQPLATAIETANLIPQDRLPAKLPRNKTMNLGLLGQFLTTALKIICDQESISASIVATAQDLRDLAAWHIHPTKHDAVPVLAQGWRAEIIGQAIEQIIDGKLAIRVSNPKLDQPLKIQRLEEPRG